MKGAGADGYGMTGGAFRFAGGSMRAAHIKDEEYEDSWQSDGSGFLSA
jgi:hypothetical protein